MKLFFTGPLNVGKSTLIDRCLQGSGAPLWGFRSYKAPAENGAGATIWLSEAARPENRQVAAHIVNQRPQAIFPEVFERLGVSVLQRVTAETKGIVLMDEIGFLESGAPAFQAEIDRVLGLPIPVIGVLRAAPHPGQAPFLDKLYADSRLTLLPVTAENRAALVGQCRALLGLV
jgi:nucleoside-triphosphatase